MCGSCPVSRPMPDWTVRTGSSRSSGGSVLRERLVDLDDDARRLVWSIVEEPYTHHNASAQVFADGADRSLFVWIADFLPNELAGRAAPLMEQALSVIKRTLEPEPPAQ